MEFRFKKAEKLILFQSNLYNIGVKSKIIGNYYLILELEDIIQLHQLLIFPTHLEGKYKEIRLKILLHKYLLQNITSITWKQLLIEYVKDGLWTLINWKLINKAKFTKIEEIAYIIRYSIKNSLNPMNIASFEGIFRQASSTFDILSK